MKSLFTKLWGCPNCGSELRSAERRRTKNGMRCPFCTSKKKLEYLGEFMNEDLHEPCPNEKHPHA